MGVAVRMACMDLLARNLRAERGRAAVALEDQRIETTEARALVARLLGISGLLVPVDTLTPMLPPTLTADSLVTLALMQRADVRVARQNIEVALADPLFDGAPDIAAALAAYQSALELRALAEVAHLDDEADRAVAELMRG